MLKITKDTEIDDLYNEEGIYAYFKDKTLSSDESYIKKHKKDTIGVAVIAEVEGKLRRIVLDKTDVSSNSSNYVYYGGYNKFIDGATTTKDEATALKDMNGKANTIAISDACHGYNDSHRTGSAAENCQIRFNGNGHLPSLGEWQMLYDNKDEVEKMMTVIGGEALKEYSYWASTLYNMSSCSWYFNWYNGVHGPAYRRDINYVRAVMEI